jgi:putative ABC transport system ATP-binding protein
VAQEPDLGTGQVRHILERPFAYHANARLWGDRLRVQELFQRFMLPAEMMDKDIVTLSGGERQRVAIVLAILLRRSIFLLDEASSARDKTARQAVAEFFKSQDGLTILSVAHDPEGFSFSKDIIELPGGSDGEG